MQKAIVDTDTRVIKRLTTDENPTIGSDETVVNLNSPITLNGFTKLDIDNETLLTPSQAEVDASGIDPSRNTILNNQKKQALRDAIADIADNGATLAKLRTYFQALKNI